MKLRKVKLKNFRCFDDFEIEFSEAHNVHVLIAENMVGKSALLRGLRIGVGGYLRSIAEGVSINSGDHRIVGNDPLSDLARMTVVETYASLLDKNNDTLEINWTIEHPNPSLIEDVFKGEPGVLDVRLIAAYMYDNVVELRKGLLPLFAYCGADYLNFKQDVLLPRDPRTGTIDQAYWKCLDGAESKSFVVNWLAYMDDVSNDQKYNHHSVSLFADLPSRSLRYITSILRKVLPEIESIQFITVGSSEMVEYASKKQLTFELPNSEIRTLDQLSDGYRYIILLAAELAIRSLILNKHIREDLEIAINGVVLIDEFGIHLHPELQNKALHRLSKAFPNVQFIVTTHSPLMLNGLKKEQVHILEMDDAGKRTVRHPDRDIVGMGAEGILLEVFGLKTTFDDETVLRVRQLQALSQKRTAEGLTDAETAEFGQLMEKVGILGYDTSLQDPLYRGFLAKYRSIMQRRGSNANGAIDDAAVEKAILELLAEDSREG